MSVTNTIRNPILPGFNPDPSICHVPGVGYFVATSTFEYFPALPVYHSTDLVEWKLIGHALNRRSQGVDMQTVETSAGMWAPTFRYHKGRWYMICSCFWRFRMQDNGVGDFIPSGFYVSTDDIFDDSKWSEAVYFEEIGFDQDLFFDDDDRVYQTVTRFDWGAGLNEHGHPKIESFINEIDLATGTSLSEPVLVSASPSGVAEGCHLLKRDGWYYLFVAEGGTADGHSECVYRSRSPTGPFDSPPEGINPVVFNDKDPYIQNTGHMDLVPIDGKDDGRWVAVFLGVRPVFKAEMTKEGGTGMPSHLGRESYMAPVEWAKDGWPVLNGGKPVEIIQKFEGLSLRPEAKGWEETFENGKLSLGWYTVRCPLRQFWDLTQRPGSIGLRGQPTTLEVEHVPAMLLRKQTEFNLDWSTVMEFAPHRPAQEAGTVVWMTRTEHAVLGLRGTADGGAEVVFKKPVDGKFETTTFPFTAEPNTPITFSVRARTKSYEFAFQIGSGAEVVAGTMATNALKPLFTGAHLGVYAQGAKQVPCLKPAYFKNIKWERVEA